MQVPFVDLKRENAMCNAEIQEAIAKVVTSGQYILGETVEKFEAEFAEYCGTKYAVAVGSGSDALRLILEAMELRKYYAKQVIVPANTFFATAQAVVQAGGEPVFVDVDPDTGLIDVDKVSRAVTQNTKAIIPVHLYGQPVEMDDIRDIADRHRLYLVEDACQAHGAEYKGKKVGSIGDAGCFSFYPTKNLGGMGDSGMVTTNYGLFRRRLQRLRNHSRTNPQRVSATLLNSRMDAIQAAILSVKLKYLDKWNFQRQVAARYYDDCFVYRGLPMLDRNVWHLYPIYTQNADKMAAYLAERGIQTGFHYKVPCHRQYAFKGNGAYCPNAVKFCKNHLSLPFFSQITKEEIDYVTDCLRVFQV